MIFLFYLNSCVSVTNRRLLNTVENTNDDQFEFVDSISQVNVNDWNRCVPANYPFLRHEFLRALEVTNCASGSTGWLPQHIVIRNTHGPGVAGVSPMYLNHDSWGEFIFDWDWAEGHHRCGLPYYPKLVSCSPFTPLTGPKLLVSPGVDKKAVRKQLLSAGERLMNERSASSVHWLFTSDTDTETTHSEGYIARLANIEYVWRNSSYRTMDDFLGSMPSRKRKKIRHERNSVAANRVVIEIIQGDQMTHRHWRAFERFYDDTTTKFGANKYLTYEFFRMLGETMPESIVLFLATMDRNPVAGSLFLQGGDALYGRYWGTLEDIRYLHFETCYYSAIEYCIERGYSSFNAGVGGVHKLNRGLQPKLVSSAHLIQNPILSEAIRTYCRDESKFMKNYRDIQASSSVCARSTEK